MQRIRSIAESALAIVGVMATLVVLSATTNGIALAAEPSEKEGNQKTARPKGDSPKTAFEYAKMVEPDLGVPPKVTLDDCIEIPLYVDGVQKYGVLEREETDNPTRLGKEKTASGSVMQRYEGKTADGKPLPDVVWVAFGRNENPDGNPGRFVGSVQMIGYNKTTGATAFFETSATAGKDLNPWITQDETTLRMRGEIPWIDEPEEFNKVFVTPAAVRTQCNSCHQADPFITSPFVNAAKIPGTDESVVPFLNADAPYYVIDGEDWDMRTIHLEDHACFECHRVGMKTLELFTSAGWDVNKRMPPHDPGSLEEDFKELLAAWQEGPENVEGADWIIPPARGKDRQVVGDDYPHKAAFNKAKASHFAYAPDTSIPNIWNAAKEGNIEEIKKFLAEGTDVNAKDDSGRTPLMLAALSGQTGAINYLIEKGADVTSRNGENGTALHGASFLGHLEAVKLLVESGADLEALNEDGESPLDVAADPWSEGMEFILQVVSDVLQIKVDREQTKIGRPKVADYLGRQRNATHMKQPSKSRDKKREATKDVGRSHYFPPTAAEYAKMVEPELGVPPKIDVGAGVEIPIYVDGVKTKGFVGDDCDNPTLLKPGITRSGSVVQRYEGKTADGKPLSDVVWVAFARHAGVTFGDRSLLGSVQMIGYHKQSGATAFFESSDAIEPWVSADPETERLVGVMPWIDEPDEFNKAYRTPGNTQCVECHQNDPFIHSSFIDAAKLPGTDEPVIPVIAGDSPYYVIGGDDWDMRTIHIEGNGCFDCHRMATGTLRLFMSNAWDPNEHMPPDDPGSLEEDLKQLLRVWQKVPDELPPGVHWVIPPARGKDGRIVGDDYPYRNTRKILD